MKIRRGPGIDSHRLLSAHVPRQAIKTPNLDVKSSILFADANSKPIWSNGMTVPWYGRSDSSILSIGSDFEIVNIAI